VKRVLKEKERKACERKGKDEKRAWND